MADRDRPPLTLTLEVSQPRSLLTAQACAANASLASIRSRSPMFQPAFFSAAREPDRPSAHDLRIDAAWPHDTMRRARCAFLGACLAVISTTAAAPSLMPEAFRRHGAVFSKRLELSIASRWRHDAIFVVSTTMSPLRDLMVTGTISVLNLRPSARLGLVLRADGELVLLGAGDLILPATFSRYCHVVAVEGIHNPSLIMCR